MRACFMNRYPRAARSYKVSGRAVSKLYWGEKALHVCPKIANLGPSFGRITHMPVTYNEACDVARVRCGAARGRPGAGWRRAGARGGRGLAPRPSYPTPRTTPATGRGCSATISVANARGTASKGICAESLSRMDSAANAAAATAVAVSVAAAAVCCYCTCSGETTPSTPTPPTRSAASPSSATPPTVDPRWRGVLTKQGKLRAAAGRFCPLALGPNGAKLPELSVGTELTIVEESEDKKGSSWLRVTVSAESPGVQPRGWLPKTAVRVVGVAGVADKYEPVAEIGASFDVLTAPRPHDWAAKPRPVLLTCEHAGDALPAGTARHLDTRARARQRARARARARARERERERERERATSVFYPFEATSHSHSSCLHHTRPGRLRLGHGGFPFGRHTLVRRHRHTRGLS